jgi:predicted nuclease of predicted toxin-antitoxin system
MNLVADESVAHPIVARLRADGHNVASIREIARGDSDEQVLVQSLNAESPLLTEDKDFGELVYRMAADHAGVVLIRLDSLSRATRVEIVSRAIRDHGPEFVDHFSVITPSGIRIRDPDSDAADSSTP